MVNKRFSVE